MIMGRNKETKRITFAKDLTTKKYTGIICVCIYPNAKWKDFNFDEPVLYMQQERKKTKCNYTVIKEIIIPLSQIVALR